MDQALFFNPKWNDFLTLAWIDYSRKYWKFSHISQFIHDIHNYEVQLIDHYCPDFLIKLSLKFFRCSLLPFHQSNPYNKMLSPKHKQLNTKKNKLWRWKPLSYDFGSVSLMAAEIKGNTDNPKFWSISIIPKPVPYNLGEINMGTVGTITVQKIDTQIPSKKTGIQGTTDDARILGTN